jgi:methyl-accepting chemotaxis protein
MFHLPERMDGAGEAPMGRPGGEMGQTVASVAMAAEVKALARSSAESAGEIAGEVETIQAHIGTTAVDVETVTGIVERLAHINAAIALAPGEQSNAAAADGRSNGNDP